MEKAMRCLHKSDIVKWVDGEMEKNPALLEHLNTCPACKAQLISEKRVRDILKASAYTLEPSETFESGFWDKVNAAIKEPWYRRVFEGIEGMIPRMGLSPALTALMVAMLVGGSGGFFAGLPSGQGGDVSLRHAAGYADYKGLPASSVAAAYLQWIERKA